MENNNISESSKDLNQKSNTKRFITILILVVAFVCLSVFSQSFQVVSFSISPEVIVKGQAQEVVVKITLKKKPFIPLFIKAYIVEQGKDFYTLKGYNMFEGKSTKLGSLEANGKDNGGNYIYQGKFTINHPVAETLEIQVKNVLGKNILPQYINPYTNLGKTPVDFPPLRLAVTTRPEVAFLPLDPGEKGKETLEGIDSDNDGLRDDLQREIFFAFPESERVRSLWGLIFKANQEDLLYAKDQQLHQKNNIFVSKISNCIGLQMDSLKISTEKNILLKHFETVFLNNNYRLEQQSIWYKNLGKVNFTVSDSVSESCDPFIISLPD